MVYAALATWTSDNNSQYPFYLIFRSCNNLNSQTTDISKNPFFTISDMLLSNNSENTKFVSRKLIFVVFIYCYLLSQLWTLNLFYWFSSSIESHNIIYYMSYWFTYQKQPFLRMTVRIVFNLQFIFKRVRLKGRVPEKPLVINYFLN